MTKKEKIPSYALLEDYAWETPPPGKWNDGTLKAGRALLDGHQ
jgi:hypothetical protein